jgi:hypothetical protein
VKSRQRAACGAKWALWSAIAMVTACSSAVAELPSISEETTDNSGGGGAQPGGAGGGSPGGGSNGVGAAADGLPCEIATLLAAKCTSCHSNPPVAYAPMALVSYADLLAPAKSDASKTNAVVSLARMGSAASPMPPSPAALASAGEIAAFAAWVNAGTPMGACGGVDAGTSPVDAGTSPVDAGPNPFDAPPQCTSNTFSNVKEGAAMKPGMGCVSCHDGSGDAPKLLVGGTAYATPHEPDKCNAQVEMGPDVSTAVVEITDKNGVVLQLAVNSVGNFYRAASKGALALPYTAKIKYNGGERAMGSPQMSGDCNGCHTQAGSNGAPGRVLLP